jgi:hypothetical protein
MVRAMNVLRNRHVLVAALVAPLLALLAYFGSAYLLGERPQKAMEGQSYPLVEKPNCRWESGACGLVNNDFELELTQQDRAGDRVVFRLESVVPLDGVLLGVAHDGDDGSTTPQPMQAEGGDGSVWIAEVAVPDPGADRIRLAASSAGVLYYGDASTAFMGGSR